jgi:hypothetical protein
MLCGKGFVMKWFRPSLTGGPRAAFRPKLEALEARTMLAADALLSNGHLVITGTDAHREEINVIRLENDAIRVTIREISPFPPPPLDRHFAAAVTSISMSGLGGFDIMRNLTSINSTMNGGEGHDILIGGGGNDLLIGETGDDTYRFSSMVADFLGKDTVWERENEGVDKLVFGEMNDGVVVDLQIVDTPQIVSGCLSLTLRGPVEDLAGSPYDDKLAGNALANRIHGFGGHDSLEGRAGDDDLFGDSGNDTYVFANTSGESLGSDFVLESIGPDSDPYDAFDFSGMSAGVSLDLGGCLSKPSSPTNSPCTSMSGASKTSREPSSTIFCSAMPATTSLTAAAAMTFSKDARATTGSPAAAATIFMPSPMPMENTSAST